MSLEPVSRREAEVLTLLDKHLSNAQIAGRLGISVRTVENHVASLLRKYGVADRRALAALAQGALGGAVPSGRIAGSPTWRTGFTGRAHERDALLALLQPQRLVTLAGPGGVGKTRLAAVAAADFPQGGAFVDLVPVREGQVTGAVARALDVRETPGQSLEDAVASAFGTARRLLILDNCEHVLDSAACLADRVLSQCPGVTVLATSRERLGVPGEHVVAISPLPLASDAEALFVDRARTADPDFAASPALVAAICARLDGMPLAIELAAARCASLGADALLAALDDTLRLLSGSRHPDERHRSLRAVIGWSFALLAEDERALFPRLAIFAGPFDLPAAHHITTPTAPTNAPTTSGRTPTTPAHATTTPADAEATHTPTTSGRTPTISLGVPATSGGTHADSVGGASSDATSRNTTPGDRVLEDTTSGDTVRGEVTFADGVRGEVTFADGVGVEAAGCAPGAVADVLGRLVDKSLVVRGREPGSWRLLETVRAYAMDRLTASGDLAEVRELHLRWAAKTAHDLAKRSTVRADRLAGPEGGVTGPKDGVTAPGDRMAGPGDGVTRPGDGLAGARDGLAGPEDGMDRFDAVGDDLRAALRNASPGPGALPHRLARSLGYLTYARRLPSQALEHFEEAARRAPTASEAAADLRTAAQTVFAVGLARGAFDLLLKSAEQAEAAGDHNAKAIALAHAVVTACRFTSGFTNPIPRPHLLALLHQATTSTNPPPHPTGTSGTPTTAPHTANASSDPWAVGASGNPATSPLPTGGSGNPWAVGGSGDPGTTPHPMGASGISSTGTQVGGASGEGVAAAYLAAAEAWCADLEASRVAAAVSAARATGDPVLVSAALDLSGTVAIRAGRFRQAYGVARERLALVDLMDRRDPAAAAEVLDAFHNAWLCAFAAGDLVAALSTAERISRDDLLGAHPYRAAGKLIPPLVLLGRFDEALERAEPMWQAWRRSGMPIAAWLSPAASAIALAHGLRGNHAAYLLWRARAERALGPGPTRDSSVFAAFVDARVAVETSPTKPDATGNGAAMGAGVVGAAVGLVARAFAGSSTGWAAAYARVAGAELAVLAGLPDADRRLAEAAAAAVENDWATARLARIRARYGDAPGIATPRSSSR